MKSFRTLARRLMIVATATTLGTAAVIAVSATPAYAHTVFVHGSKDCVNGNWVVTWKVTQDQQRKTGTITQVTHTPSVTLSTIVPTKTVAPGAELTETVTLPGSTTSATLTVRMTWPQRPGYDDGSKTLYFKRGDCVPPPSPKIEVTTDSTCDEFSVTVKNTGTVQATGTVTPSGGSAESFDLAAGESKTFTFPASVGSATVALGNNSEAYEWKDPGDCPTPTTPPATTPPTTTTTPPLPVTGTSLTSLIGVGGALVLVGGALLMVLRRRRRLGES